MRKSHEFEAPQSFNLPPDKIDDYDFKVHINGKTHQLVLKDDYDRLQEWRAKDQSAIEAKDHEIVRLKAECERLQKRLLDFEGMTFSEKDPS